MDWTGGSITTPPGRVEERDVRAKDVTAKQVSGADNGARAGRWGAPVGGSGSPPGLRVGAGAVGVVAAALVAAAVPGSGSGVRVGLVAAVVAVLAAVTADPAATVVTVVVAFLIVNGFLVDQLGELSWHGRPDAARLAALAVAAGAGLGVGRLRRRIRAARHDRAVDAWLRHLTAPPAHSTVDMEEDGRGA
jgi:hypothetical protein